MAGQGNHKLGSFLTTVDGLIAQHQWADKETALKTLLENWFFEVEETPSIYYGILKRWGGSSWVKEPLKTYLAGSWQSKPLKRWSGTGWKEIDTTGV